MATQEVDTNEFEATIHRNKPKPPWLLSIFKKSFTCLTYAILFQRSCLVGFWLGILPRNLLHGIDESYFTGEKMYVSDKYNRRGLFGWEEEVIKTYFRGSKNILLLSAGGGREVYGLQKFDCQVDAYECHPQLVDHANDFLTREGLPNSVKLIKRDECPQNGWVYDGAIVGWGGYMLTQTRNMRVTLLRKIREQLVPNAPVLISFFTRNENEKRFKLISKIANIFRFILRRESIETGDSLLPPTYVHHFTKDEIMTEFSKVGIKLVFFSTKPYGHAVGIVEEVKQLSLQTNKVE